MVKKIEQKKKIRWSAMQKVEDISPRKSKDWEYCVLKTSDGIRLCCSVSLATNLCLFESYEMKGEVNITRGGTYLILTETKLFNGENFSIRP